MAGQRGTSLQQRGLGASTARLSAVMSSVRPVVVPAAVPGDLGAGRAPMTTEPVGDLGGLFASPDPVTDLFALAQGQGVRWHAGCSTGRGLCRSAEHTSELQSLIRISYAVFCF